MVKAQNALGDDGSMFLAPTKKLSEASKTPRQTASDRKWEGCAWISPEQLASNVDKRPRNVVHAKEAAAEEEEDIAYPIPRPPEPCGDKDMDRRRRDKDRIPSETTWAWDKELGNWKSVPRPRVVEVGMFFSYIPIPVKQVVLLEWLLEDSDKSALNADFLRKHLIPRLNRTHPVSLRLLDWLVVDYAREKGIAYRWFFPHINQIRLVVVYSLYFEWLTRWRRRHYDVFRRRHRIYFTLDGQTYSTTVAQLHFFYMADLYGFLEFAQQNAEDIEAHMQAKLGITNDIKRKAQESGQVYRRRPLVNKCPPKAYISQGECVLSFKVGDETSSEEEGESDEDGGEGKEEGDDDDEVEDEDEDEDHEADNKAVVGDV